MRMSANRDAHLQNLQRDNPAGVCSVTVLDQNAVRAHIAGGNIGQDQRCICCRLNSIAVVIPSIRNWKGTCDRDRKSCGLANISRSTQGLGRNYGHAGKCQTESGAPGNRKHSIQIRRGLSLGIQGRTPTPADDSAIALDSEAVSVTGPNSGCRSQIGGNLHRNSANPPARHCSVKRQTNRVVAATLDRLQRRQTRWSIAYDSPHRNTAIAFQNRRMESTGRNGCYVSQPGGNIGLAIHIIAPCDNFAFVRKREVVIRTGRDCDDV